MADITSVVNTPSNEIASRSFVASNYVPYSGATTNVNVGANTFIGAGLKANGSGGILLESNNGTDIALFGAGGGANATFYDGVKLDSQTADRVLGTDASKNIVALNTTTYPSLTELSYVKGVTSAIQTQLDTNIYLNPEISITTTATATINRMHVCSGTTSDYTVTLPPVSGNTGKLIGFRMSPNLTKAVTIDGDASETIDGSTSRIMFKNEVAVLYCDGSTWTKVQGKTIPLICVMSRTTAQTSISSATEVHYTVNSTITDNSGLMADTTNSRIYIRRPGTYMVAPVIRYKDLGSNVARLIGTVEKNGAMAEYRHQGEVSALAGAYPFVNQPSLDVYVAGDYLQAYGYTDGSGLTIASNGTTAESFFSVIEYPTW